MIAPPAKEHLLLPGTAGRGPWVVWVLALVASALLFTGCSGGSGSEGAPASSGSGGESGDASTDTTTLVADDATSTSEAAVADDGESDTLPEQAPDRFFAITAVDYELVEVDTRSGEIVTRFGGWGASAEGCEDECYLQAMDTVDLGSDGRLWITDCCEPAVGNIFVVEAGTALVPDDARRSFGLSPTLSPDGALLASSALEDVWIEQMLADPAQDPTRFPEVRDEDEVFVQFSPVAWFDDTSLLVRVTGDLVDNLVRLDLSDPSVPRQVGPTFGGVVSMPDAAIRADGNVLALQWAPRPDRDLFDARDVEAVAFDAQTGAQIGSFDLPDDVYAIDYDDSRTYLITIGDDGVARWYGAGREGRLGEGFVAVTW